MLMIFTSSVEELSIGYNIFYHTIQNFVADFANQVSLQLRKKYIYVNF